MNPYEANPDKIPLDDQYADLPLYGRYYPKPDDFQPSSRHTNSTTVESLRYWASVLTLCDASVRIFDDQDGGRDVFALGGVIIKSGHLNALSTGRRATRDYSYADANEVEATDLARKLLKEVKVPKIYFASKIDGRDVLVQERIPGVGLNIAWQYISRAQKESFMQQAREVLRQLGTTTAPSWCRTRSYLAPDQDPVKHRGIQKIEYDIIFSSPDYDPDLGFMHNDFTLSNCIVDNDRIVGLVDWEMAGYFGWKAAGEVHAKIRTPQRQSFSHLNLSEEVLDDVLFWTDLYTT